MAVCGMFYNSYVSLFSATSFVFDSHLVVYFVLSVLFPDQRFVEFLGQMCLSKVHCLCRLSGMS